MHDSAPNADDRFAFDPVPAPSDPWCDFAPAPEPAAGTDPFDFAPVPISARRDGWTPQRQRDFIAALARHGGVTAAARMVGMTPQSARRLRRRAGAEGFALAWDTALDEGRLRSYDAAMARIHVGYRVPVRRNGEVVGYRHRTDTRLMFAALRHLLPGGARGG